jgi:F-type H+-transporting ATPase subunit epsilon
MEDSFKIEIISPEKIIFSDNAKIVTIPAYEGNMSILKNHISIITFLRPGIVKVKKDNEKFEIFFVKEGTVEFFNNILLLLSDSIENTKNLSKEFIDNLSKKTEAELNKEDISDKDRYVLNHQLDTLKDIRL